MAGEPDFLDMSDEDFLKQMPASGEAPAVEQDSTTAEEVGETQVEEPVVETTTEEAPVTTEAKPVTSRKKAPVAAVVEAEVKPEATAKKPSTAVEPAEGEQTGAEATEGEVEAAVAPDYESFYQKIMTPFKANGRTVELKTPEEAIQLMQMGANYTKKMQDLVPHRKMITMLQNNGLMDEGKLSYLIDLDKKNPEAIKKLLKDSGVDPLEIDTSVEPAYREGNHRVSDDEVNFHQTLEDMQSSPEQVKTLEVINGDWDQVSKEALWKNPEIMTVIHGQRENGLYDQIVAEVNRRKTFGKIPGNVPFLQAYKAVGDEMTKANAFVNIKPAAVNPQVAAQQVIATRVAAPKPMVKNGERAAAASTNRSTPQKGKGPAVNPLSMSDDDFLKQLAGRV